MADPPNAGYQDVQDNGEDSDSDYMGDFEDVSESLEQIESFDEDDDIEIENTALR